MDRLKRAEHIVKRLAYVILRLFLKKGKPSHPPLQVSEMDKILLLRPETKLGDMVVSLPVVDALKQHYPHLKVSIWCSPRNAVLIAGDPRFYKVHLYRKRLPQDLTELRRVRAEKYSCVVDLLCDDSVTSLVLSQYAAPGRPRLGMGKVRFERFYDFDSRTEFDPAQHIILNTLRTIAPLGIVAEDCRGRVEPYLDPAAQNAAADFMSKLGDEPLGAAVGVNLSSGHPTREWGETKTKELMVRVLRDYTSLRIVAIATPADRQRAREMTRQLGDRVVLVPDGLGIVQVAAIIKHLRLLITPDTALVHIARAFDVPVVSMHTCHARNLALWRPYEQDIGTVVGGSVDDIHDITVDRVYAAFIEVATSLQF
ncbi:MAG: glycosyltransferase family 9 protein [bacterium]